MALLLSVKPQQMPAALADLSAGLVPHTLIISIAAGVRTEFIESHLRSGESWRVIRTMPNTPMLVGQGMVAIARGAHATAEDAAAARRIFEYSATVLEVEEAKMNAVTALSGSGPAYFFYLAEHMMRAAIELGMTGEQADTLVRKTALGAATMLAALKDPPAELRRKVTSPGGTTQAAIDAMEAKKMGEIIVDAIQAAEERGRELGG